MVDEPHDRLFKETFQSPSNAAVELRAVLPASLLNKIDLTSLRLTSEETIGRDLSKKHCDLLYEATIAGELGYIYLLLEHQSSVDRLMPFRVMEYVTRVLSRHVKQSPEKERLPLPVVIPIVVHHSETGWTAATEVLELFSESARSIPEIRAYLPRLSFFLDDISNASDEALKARALAASERIVPLVFWALRDARTADRIMASFHVWADVIAEIARSPTGRDALIAVIKYLMQAKAELSREQIETIIAEAAPEARETYMTLAEQLEQQGMKQGQTALLTKQLRTKFGNVPDEVLSRLRSATPSELERWAERVLSAESLEDVLN